MLPTPTIRALRSTFTPIDWARYCVVCATIAIPFATERINAEEEVGAEEVVAVESVGPQATIKLKDGSIIFGEVVGMKDGELKVKTDFGGDVPVKWTEIAELLSKLELRLVLTDERTVNGTVQTDGSGGLSVQPAGADDPVLVPFSAVSAINPPPPPGDPVTFKGNVNAGLSILDGNSDTKAANANAELVVRNKTHRGTLKGRTNYAENDGSVSARNSRGSLKYDFFYTKRAYLFASGMLEGDSFQNLELRKVVSGGLGYQFIENGDFENEHFNKLAVFGELGVSYFHEDFQDTTENEFVSGRWAFQVDWEFLPGQITFFHRHEGYPNFEDFDDLLIDTEQGLRFNLYEGLTASLQVNWRWDNVPAAGAQRADTMYLFNLGYAFDTKL